MDKKFHRRDFLKSLTAAAASLTLPGCTDAIQSKAQKGFPDILLLFTDDQRFSAIGALGIESVKTPNIDKLIRAGTTFTNAHIMGSDGGAVCMPSRAMLLTGRDLFSLDKSTGSLGQNIPTHHTTLPELLRAKDYETFFAGKWHQDRNSFKRAFTQADNIFFGGMTYKPFAAKFHHYDSTRGNFKSFTADKHTSNMIADVAVDFLSRQSNASKPFFAMASFLAPHDPRTAPENYHVLYPPEKIDLPANFMPEHPFDNGEMKIRDEKLADWPRTPEAVKKHIADYYAMITHLDAQIGHILNALEKTGRAKNTIIIFASDNGLALGQHGLLGKQSLYDHSVRVPLIFTCLLYTSPSPRDRS